MDYTEIFVEHEYFGKGQLIKVKGEYLDINFLIRGKRMLRYPNACMKFLDKNAENVVLHKMAEEKQLAEEYVVAEKNRILDEKWLIKSKSFINLLKNKYKITLNSDQQRAVSIIEGPVLLLAVPGSGKTTVLISRLANMIANFNISPEEILTLTFSKRSADDMEQRYKSIFKDYQVPHFSTIHSFCYGVVKNIAKTYDRPIPTLIDNVNAIIRKLSVQYDKYVTAETIVDIVTQISYCNNQLHPEVKKSSIVVEDFEHFEEVYDAYSEYKHDESLMDYDDMLLFTYKMFENPKNHEFLKKYQNMYKYVCIDEAQDTSPIQNAILKLIVKTHENLFMVGDEDQSIYGFRGAAPEEILDFEKKYEKAAILKMEENFRSTKEIIQAANTLIKNNKNRLPKQMITNNIKGNQVQFIEQETLAAQYNYVNVLCKKLLGNTAVLFRYKDSVLPLVWLFEKSNIPYILKNRREIPIDSVFMRAIISTLRIIDNQADYKDFDLFYNRFNNKINLFLSQEQLQKLKVEYKRGKDIFTLLYAVDSNKIPLEAEFEAIRKKDVVSALADIDTMVKKYFSKKFFRQYSWFECIAQNEQSIASLLNTVEKLKNICKAGKDCKNGINLATIHSSKGLEYDNVVLMDLIDKQFPAERSIKDTTDKEEETRVCYVAITRARNNLYIISSSKSNKNFKRSKFVPMMCGDTDCEYKLSEINDLELDSIF